MRAVETRQVRFHRTHGHTAEWVRTWPGSKFVE